jgi:hypothetical protein
MAFCPSARPPQTNRQGRWLAPLPTGVLVTAFSVRVIFGICVIDTPRPSAVDLDDGFFIREGLVRHAGREREEASSRQRLGVALSCNVAHAERAVLCSRSRRELAEAFLLDRVGLLAHNAEAGEMAAQLRACSPAMVSPPRSAHL